MPGDGARRFEVGFVDGVVLREFADEGAGIDVDGGHRFGLVDDEVAAGFEGDVAFQRQRDFFFDAIALEQAAVAVVEFEVGRHVAEEVVGKGPHLFVGIGVVNHDAAHFRGNVVAQHFLIQRQFAVDKGAGAGLALLAEDVFPDALQVLHIGAHRPEVCGLNRSADDKAALLAFVETGDGFAQALPLFFGGDFCRDADVFGGRQIDEEARGDGDFHGQPRALAADGIFQHLHQQRLPFAHHLADAGRRLVAAPHHVLDVQETGTFQANIDKSGVHPWQDALHLAFVNVADDAALALALDKNILQHAVAEQGDAGFVGRMVDENLGARCYVVCHVNSLAPAKTDRCNPARRNPATTLAAVAP